MKRSRGAERPPSSRPGAPSAIPSASGTSWHLFAIAAPGLEPWVARELAAMGIAGEEEPGGVAFAGGLREIHDANLRLRTASRIVARVGEFAARTFAELERGARRLAWDRVLAAGAPVRLRVACRKSRLYHSDAVAERVHRAIAERLGADPVLVGAAPGDEASEAGDEPAEAQRLLVRVHRDRVTVSADASGALLHRRGYRQATAKAPLRETLAAAVVMAAGWWRPGQAAPAGPLLDPMCGSGTIPIEAALMARRIAPGAGRRFAVLEWPGHDERLWRERQAAARAEELSAAPVPILGSDRDAGAIEAAMANADRAGVLADLTWARSPLSAIRPPGGATNGHLLTNPPYGVRVGDPGPLRDLYAQLGATARRHFAGWTLAMLAADARLAGHVGLPLLERLRTVNGGIPVRLLCGRVPDGADAEAS